ncbi:MAG: hypothetical protein DMG96_20000 [Acidobacteria bacterium]|nr:MAG: hypothetical protein DMG96_20000 [Acidobacteriota bacterium]
MGTRIGFVARLLMLTLAVSWATFQSRGQSGMTSKSLGDSTGTRAKQDDLPPCNSESHCRIGDYCFSAGVFTATILQMSDGRQETIAGFG